MSERLAPFQVTGAAARLRAGVTRSWLLRRWGRESRPAEHAGGPAVRALRRGVRPLLWLPPGQLFILFTLGLEEDIPKSLLKLSGALWMILRQLRAEMNNLYSDL